MSTVVPPSYSVSVADSANIVTPSYSISVVDVSTIQQCQPIIRTGISFLDNVLFCVGGYGVTVLIGAIILLILLILR